MKLNPDEFIKLLSDSTRLRSLMLLLAEDELCVCELTAAIGESQPKISRHLASLRSHKIVVVRRAGQWIYYKINPGLPDWVFAILNATLKAMQAEKQFKTDLKKLKNMPDRPVNGACP